MKPQSDYGTAVLFTANWLCGHAESVTAEQKSRWQISVKIDGISRFEIHCKSQRVYDYTKGIWRDFSGENRWVDIMSFLSEFQTEKQIEDLEAEVNTYFARRIGLAKTNKHEV